MILVDRALQARATQGRPLRVAMVGAGFMGRGIAKQIVSSTPGMRLVAIANRTPEHAERAFAEAGVEDVTRASTAAQLERAVAGGHAVVTDDPLLLAGADAVEALIEVTGAVEYAAHVVLEALRFGKHVVLMNAELDGTVGPILQTYARRSEVVLSASDGDQPGVQANLLRFVRGIGLEPLVAGNIKGLQDPYRTPTTQEAFARRWGQSASMVTSFADGTKISFEQAIVANAFGFTVPRRGMNGFEHREHIDAAVRYYQVEELRRLGGIVDYVVGAAPAPGVFVFATHDDARQRHFLDLYKLGEGPLYSFYAPYHLCHFEAPTSLARAALFGDAVMAADGAPRVEVVATAKRDLQPGEHVDGLGGYLSYGQCETAEATARDGLLPIGVAEGCTLTRAVARDAVLRYADVRLPEGRLVDALRAEQAERFPAAPAAAR